MTLRELRDELRNRGASDEGTKGALERRLARAALVAAGHEEESATEEDLAARAAQDAISAAGRLGVETLLAPYDESAHAPVRGEAAARVALLLGGAAGDGRGAAAALAAARALADALQTAPLRGAAAWGALGGAAPAGGGAPAGAGVSVEPIWVDAETGAAWQVPLAALYALEAPDLALQLPSLAVGAWGAPAELAAHLSSGAAHALSLLPPAAGPGAAALAAALSAAGVAAAGALAPAPGGGAAPAAGGGGARWALLRALAGAGFPTLPALLLEAPDFGLAQGAAPAPAAAREAAAAAAAAALAAVDDAAAAGGAPPAPDGAVVARVAEWCAGHGLDDAYATFALSSGGDAGGEALATACGAARAALAARAMLEAGARGARAAGGGRRRPAAVPCGGRLCRGHTRRTPPPLPRPQARPPSSSSRSRRARCAGSASCWARPRRGTPPRR